MNHSLSGRSKAFAAEVAGERFGAGMDSFVNSSLARLAETFATVAAFEGFVVFVHSDMTIVAS